MDDDFKDFHLELKVVYKIQNDPSFARVNI